MAEIIVTARTADHYSEFAGLIREYTDWSRARYGHEKWFVDAAFSHQALDAELQELPKSYGRPAGRTLLAIDDGQVQGCVAYRKLSGGICEMKRLFVPERFHGKGIGRRLCAALFSSARDDGYAVMRLDTGNRLTEAIRLYELMGFRRIAAYHDYPKELMPYLIFMEKPLSERT